MAARTNRVGPVRSEAFANRQTGGNGIVIQRGYVRQRRWRRGAEEVVENPFSPDHRRGARGIRGNGEDAALPEQPATLPLGVVGERNATEVAAVDVRNAIVL